MNQVVTELVIDARGAETGSAAYVRAMQVAQQAVDRLRDRENALRDAHDTSGASMVGLSTTTARAASAYDRLKASIDPVFAAAKGLERDLLTLDRAVTRLGVSEAESSRMLDLIVVKHDAAAAAARRQADEYTRLAAAGRAQYALDQSSTAGQAMWNTYAGVRDPSTDARASGAAFAAELDRLDQLASQKAQQIAGNFTADLNTRLVAGTSKSARDAATVFSAELDRMDDIARMRASEAGAAFTADLNTRLGVGQSAGSARGSASVFLEADRGMEAYQDRVRAVRQEIDPLTAAIERQQTELAELAVMMQRGDLSTEQFAQGQAIAAQRVAQLRFQMQQTGRNRQMGGNIMSSINSAQQFQDILITSMMGQSVGTIALQQGTQLGTAAMMSSAGAGGGAVGLMNSLRASVAALANPVMIGAVAFTALSAAAIQAFARGGEKAKTFNDLLTEQKNIIERLGPAYEGLEKRIGDMFIPTEDVAVGNVMLRKNAEAAVEIYQAELSRALRNTRSEPSSAMWGLLGMGVDLSSSEFGRGMLEMQSRSGEFAPFEPILRSLEEGRITILEARREIELLSRTEPGLRKVAEDFIKVTDAAADTFIKLQGIRSELQRGALVGPGAMGRAEEAFDPFAALRRRMYPDDFPSRNMAVEEVELQRMRAESAARSLQMRAKSPAEQAAAARSAAEAAASSDESPAARALRIELAATEALEQATYSLDEAQRDRLRSYDATLASQQLDLDLIGKTVGEIERLRMEFDLTQQIREEAARNNIAVDEREIALIKEKAAAYGMVADQIARATLRDDLVFDQEQMFRSPIDQRIASTMRGAGLAIDFESEIAGMIRLNEQLALGRDLALDFAGGLSNDLRNGVEPIDALTNAFGRLGDRLLDMAMDQAINSLFANLAGSFGGGSGPAAGSFRGAQTVSSGGGFWDSILDWFLNANGNAFDRGNVIPFARGGAFTNSIVDKPTLFPFANGTGIMGEAGPEAIMPLRRGSDGRLGVSAANQNGGSSRVQIEVMVGVNDDGTLAVVARQAGRDGGSEAADVRVHQFSRHELPDRMNEINQHPRKRG